MQTSLQKILFNANIKGTEKPVLEPGVTFFEV